MRRGWQYLRRLGEGGATAVEFAIVGSVFLMLLLAIFELGFMVFVQSVLDGSARSAARMIRTGQAQTSGNAETFFQTSLCSAASSVIGCGNLIYQVRQFPNWSGAQTAVNTPPARDPITGKLISAGFNAGNCGQIEAVQVTYDYKFFTLWVGQYLGDSTQSTFLMSTVVFQNEPFCSGALPSPPLA
ncbi:MAG: TadE/TadG family type IV pilus assembly protein [Stellaceae bacterium]